MDEQAQYDAILGEFYRRMSLDPQIRSIMRKVERGKADFSDTAALSERASNLLGEVFGKEILSIPEEARESLCTALLKERYSSVNETLAGVQEALDEPLGIHLTPQRAAFPAERVQQLGASLRDPGVKPETIRRRADKPVATVAKSFHDDFIKANAKKRSDLGLKPILQRIAATGACKWCAEVAGKWRFGEQPEDVFRRHDNCDCVIIYDTQVLRGARNDTGRSKTWTEVDPAEVEAQGFKPTVFSPEEARELERRLLERLTKPGQGDIMRVADAASAAGVRPAASSQEELERKTKQYDKMLDGYTSRKSKWSGNVFLVSESNLPSAYGEKKWNCSISIRDDAGDKTIIHELLHARSCSYYTILDFKKCRAIEEASVELLAQEICKKQSIPYSESYPLFVGYLRGINQIARIENSDFDFARKLFEVDMTNRHTWLCDRVVEAIQNNRVSQIGKLTIGSYLHALEGFGDLA